MSFHPFRRRRDTRATPEAPDTPGTAGQPWRASGIADEVAAFLEGRYVDFLVGKGRTSVPAWAALNRLAHVDHAELTGLVAGTGVDGWSYGGRRPHAWAERERFLAAQLLATVGATSEGLRRAQWNALIPAELVLIARADPERLGADDVLDAAAEALDAFSTGP